MSSGEQAPHQSSALSAQLAKLAKPGAAAFRIICNNLKQQQCSVRNTMDEVQVNGSYRLVVELHHNTAVTEKWQPWWKVSSLLKCWIILKICNDFLRSVIKVNGDAEENYLFPAHLLDKLQDVDIKQVYKCKFRRTHFLQIQWESLNRSTYWRDVYQLTFL